MSRRTSTDEDVPSKFPLTSTFEAFTRPISALARHRVHQLSEIREVSTSSRTGPSTTPIQEWIDGAKDRPVTPEPSADAMSHTTSSECITPTAFRSNGTTYAKAFGNRAASAISLPVRQIPQRRSSASILSRSLAELGPHSMQDLPSWRLPEWDGTDVVISDKGRTNSPVRRAIGRGAQSSELLRPPATRTFVRTTPPNQVLDNGSLRHPRVEISVHLPSPLFVGGGTAEGRLSIQVDGGVSRKPKTKPIFISKASVDVIGVEEVHDGRRWVFLSLATDLIDDTTPPPPSLVISQHAQDGPELWWELKSGTAVLPFRINLPLKLGPPPYSSRQASIRYLLCPSVTIRIGDKRSVVRQTWSVQMLTIHDPEKALASLPSPLLAADTMYISREPDIQIVKLTAGLHRQTWVNGGMIFVDIHISNNTSKSIKKAEVQLEKITLWYTHAAAGTSEKSANHLRLPKRTDTEIVSGTTVKKSTTWNGVPPHSSDVRTIELEAPKGHVTISSGRYFEIRYFVNVVIHVKMFKTLAVQLPVTIIPINSLDIPPNSLAQVAASIEAKRARTVPIAVREPGNTSFHQGYAFSVPVRRSLELQERGRLPGKELDSLTRDIDSSPRRFAQSRNRSHRVGEFMHDKNDENAPPIRASMASSHHHHLTRHPSCYHCHLTHETESIAKPQGPRLPRLQVSTSGLGFSESEFEVPADSPPRKVMLSEEERNMINQIRELKTRHQRHQKKAKKPIKGTNAVQEGRESQDQLGWNNVVADSDVGPKQPEHGNLSPKKPSPQKRSTQVSTTIVEAVSGSINRSRAKTNPEGLGRLHGSVKPRRKSSTDRHERGIISVDGSGYGRMPRRPSKDTIHRASLDHLF